MEKEAGFGIVIHGGAGVVSKTISKEKKELYLSGLADALQEGLLILKSGGTSLDAVEKAVRSLEDNPLFNAGKGAVYNSEGKHELDASIMDGKTLSCGAVAGVTTIKNPISLARQVMEKSGHILLIGDGAEKFASKPYLGPTF
jgi:beta-aspartyl-peptidase (threonine type)